MRIYHQIEEIVFDDPDKQAVIGVAANEQIQLLAELHKYKMMWALRSMEKEIEQSGGIIYLVSKPGVSSTIRPEGFTADMEQRVRSLLVAAKFLK